MKEEPASRNPKPVTRNECTSFGYYRLTNILSLFLIIGIISGCYGLAPRVTPLESVPPEAGVSVSPKEMDNVQEAYKILPKLFETRGKGLRFLASNFKLPVFQPPHEGQRT